MTHSLNLLESETLKSKNMTYEFNPHVMNFVYEPQVKSRGSRWFFLIDILFQNKIPMLTYPKTKFNPFPIN